MGIKKKKKTEKCDWSFLNWSVEKKRSGAECFCFPQLIHTIFSPISLSAVSHWMKAGKRVRVALSGNTLTKLPTLQTKQNKKKNLPFIPNFSCQHLHFYYFFDNELLMTKEIDFHDFFFHLLFITLPNKHNRKINTIYFSSSNFYFPI